jgi:hypothetical protein
MKRTLLFIVFLITSFSSVFGQAEPTLAEQLEQSKWRVLDEEKYLISHPIDWELDQSSQMGTSFMLFSPLSSSDDQFRENVNLIIQDLAGQNITMDIFTELSEGQIKTMLVDGKIISSERQNAEGQEFHKAIFSGRQGIFNLQFEQYYWIKEEKAFVLTLTCESETFATYQKVGEEMLNSFKVK